MPGVRIPPSLFADPNLSKVTLFELIAVTLYSPPSASPKLMISPTLYPEPPLLSASNTVAPPLSAVSTTPAVS